MKYEILKTIDFRGTLGLKHEGEIVEIENEELIKQFTAQGLIKPITNTWEQPRTINRVITDTIDVKED